MAEIDTKDIKLIDLLEQHSRMSLTSIAKKLKISREAVNYRIKRLQKKEIITKFITLTDLKQIGFSYYAVYIKFKNIEKKVFDNIIDYVNSKEEVVWSAILGGKYNFVFELAVKDVLHLIEIYNQFLNNFSDNIIKKDISIRTDQHLFSREKSKLKDKDFSYSKNIKRKSELISIDDIDYKILGELRKNSRMSFVKLGKKINVPVTTVINRVKKLKQKNIIASYSIFLNRKKLGYQTFKVFIFINNYSQKQEQMLYTYCMTKKKVYYYLRCVGSWNYELEVDAESLDDFYNFLNELRGKFHYVISNIDFVPIFSEEKYVP